MFPTLNTEHKAEALAFLTDHYKGKSVVEGLVKTFANRVQDLETAIWDVINGFLLSKPPVGDQLDKIGTIVGAARGALDDTDYLALIKLQIRVNRSAGLAEDVIQVASLALGHKADQYLDMDPAQFILEVWDLTSAMVLAGVLSHVRSTGTRGVLHYSTWVDGSDFEWTSSYVDVGEEGWGSVYDVTTGGLMVAGAEF